MEGVKKLCTSPYHPQTNGQCECFNSTLLNMWGTLTPEQKKDWKSHVSAMVHAYNCTRNAATGFSPYYLLFGREPKLPVDVEFGLQRGSQRGPLGESNYVSQLRRRLRFAHNKAKLVASRQQARHKGLYDRNCRGAILGVGDLVLIKQTAWKGRHKIQDCWEEEEYQVVDQPTPGVPVYVVKSIAGGRPRVLHRNLLLALQCRIRQEGVTREDSSPDLDSEGETPEAPRATHGRPRRASHVTSTRKRGAPIHLSGDRHPTLTSLPSPEHMPGDEDSSEDEEHAIPAIPVGSPPSTTEVEEGDKQSATPELVTDMFSDVQPLPDQTINDVNRMQEQEPESDSESDTDSPVPTAPRRSARSTKGHTSSALWTGTDQKYQHIRTAKTYQV